MSTPPAALTNWAGNVRYRAAGVHRPTSLDELRFVVAGAERIRALGSGHSFSPLADTTGDLVRLDGLPPVVEVDRAASTVTVAAGVRYAELARRLHEAGYALANMASLPHISVAGCCATGTHGSGDRLPCLAAAVSALQLVGPGGELVDLRRDTDPDVFPGAVVALGALGVVTRLTLDVEPAFEVAQRVLLDVPLGEVAADLDAVFGSAYSVSVFTDWRGGTAGAWVKRRLDRAEAGWAGGRPATEPDHPVNGLPPEACTEQLDVPGPWHERLPHFRADHLPSAGAELQSELLLPRAAAPAAFAELSALGSAIAPVLHVSEVRTIRADDLWLSPAYGRDTVGFHFTWFPDPAVVLPVIAAVEERLGPMGARPHWGKLTTMAGPEIVARYERAPDFARLLRSFDPGGKFRNPYIDELFPAT